MRKHFVTLLVAIALIGTGCIPKKATVAQTAEARHGVLPSVKFNSSAVFHWTKIDYFDAAGKDKDAFIKNSFERFTAQLVDLRNNPTRALSNHAGPGMYFSPDPFTSRSFGNMFAVVKVKRGAKIFFQPQDNEMPNVARMPEDAIEGILYPWKFAELSNPEAQPSVLNKNTLVLRHLNAVDLANSFVVDPRNDKLFKERVASNRENDRVANFFKNYGEKVDLWRWLVTEGREVDFDKRVKYVVQNEYAYFLLNHIDLLSDARLGALMPNLMVASRNQFSPDELQRSEMLNRCSDALVKHDEAKVTLAELSAALLETGDLKTAPVTWADFRKAIAQPPPDTATLDKIEMFILQGDTVATELRTQGMVNWTY